VIVNNEEFDWFGYILLRAQWQRFTPRSQKHIEKPKKKLRDPIFIEYHMGRVSRTELCRHCCVQDSAYYHLLVEKGEIFAD